MKNMLLRTGLVLFTALPLFYSCKEDEPTNEPPPDFNSEGVYIVNEGAFQGGNASVSYFDIKNQVMSNNIFQTTNGFPLGDVGQSMTTHNGKGYIVVNNSQKIEVVNLSDFTSVATISGLTGPRYMVVRNNKGYVSDWFSNTIRVIDLASNTVIKSIPTGEGPEGMAFAGNKLFVANVGGWNSDSTVTVINADTDSLLTTVEVGLNPNSVVTDLNGAVWVLCGGSLGPDFTGGTADDIGGAIWKLDPASLTASEAFSIANNKHPVKLRPDGSSRFIYFLNGSDGYTGSIWKFDAVPANIAPFNVVNKQFYGLGVDPGSGYLYGGYVPGFQQNGHVFRYQGGGTLIDSVEAGIAPAYFVFKN